jgi:chain length determinant protein EpsF
MSFTQFLAILRARGWLALAIVALTMAATLAVSLLLPRQYTASASVVVDFKPDPVSAAMLGSLTSPAVMATQVDILRSERVALRVARDLRLDEDAALRRRHAGEAGPAVPIERWLVAEVLAKGLEVRPSRESSVIQVSFKATDAQRAAALANAFVDAYVRTSVELRTDPARQYNSFFDGRAKEARDRLEAAQTRLSAYQNQHGIIVSDERLDAETQRLNELTSQVVTLQALAAESSSRAAQAGGEQGERLQEVLSNPVLAQLKSDLTGAESRLKELNTRYGEAHPHVLAARASVGEMHSRLEAETRKVTGSVGVTSSINRSREAQLRGGLEHQRGKVQRIKQLRDEAMLLERDVGNARREYDAIQQRATQSSLESEARLTNVNLLSEAVPPIEPSSPRLLLNAALALVVGTLLAVGTTLAMERADRRVRGPDDLVATLDLPVVGVMLKPGASGRLGRRKLSLMQQRLLAALPSVADPRR